MARIVQIEFESKSVSDADIEYVMEMLRIVGRWVTKDVSSTVKITQGEVYTSL